MANPNTKNAEILYCEAQISWRKQTLADLEQKFKAIELKLKENFRLHEPELFECSEQIKKIKGIIAGFEARLRELQNI